MNPLPIPLPRGARVVFNSLYDSRDPILLTQDVLLVSLPNDTFIDVGWYPEHDRKGTYQISVYREDWLEQLLPEPIRTQHALKVVEEVSRLAERYSTESITRITLKVLPPRVINTSGSTTMESLFTHEEVQHA